MTIELCTKPTAYINTSPPPSYSSSSISYSLIPIFRSCLICHPPVFSSQYIKFPHTRLAVLMLDTLVKRSSKQVYLHTSSWQGECPSIFWLPVVPWVCSHQPTICNECSSSSTTQGTQGPPQQVSITCIYPNIRCDEKQWFAVQSDMELNMFCMSTFLKIEYFERE